MTAPLVEVTDSPPQEAYLQLWAPLAAFNAEQAGSADSQPFAVLLRDPQSREVVGGLWARALWGSFYIDMIVLPQALRGAGMGRELMRQAEAAARARGCRHVWLDTYAFQARGFYERLGYSVFGELDGPAPIFPRYFMKKDLV